jgi:hypothetical protein
MTAFAATQTWVVTGFDTGEGDQRTPCTQNQRRLGLRSRA